MKTKRPTLKEIRARAAENAYCAASSILRDKWRPIAWEDMEFNKNPTANLVWECIEKIDKLCSEQAAIRRELEDERRT